MTTELRHPHSGRLNPFALPPETAYRFALLILVVLATTLFIWNFLYFTVTEPQGEYRTYARCNSLADKAGQTGAPPAETRQIFDDCRAPRERDKAAFMLAGVGLVTGLGLLIYWATPYVKIRRRRLVRLSDDDIEGIEDYFGQLCREAGLAKEPQLLWSLRPTAGALAFGSLGRYYVALDAGLVAQFTVDRRAFRAIVFHELAHLRNRDVGKAYFALSIWYAFVAAALLPFPVSIFDEGAKTIFEMTWRVAVLALLVYLTRNAVLRTREQYADVRASLWEGPGGALRGILERTPAPAKTRFTALFALHPDPRERLSTVDHTEALFRPRFFDAFAAGLAAAIAFPQLNSLVALLTTGSHAFDLSWTVAALLCASLAATVVALGAWRSSLAALAGVETASRVARLGFGLATGLIAGGYVSFDRAIRPDSGGGLQELETEVAWVILVIVLALLFVAWLATIAPHVIELAAISRSPRLVVALALSAAAAIFAWGFGQLYTVSQFLSIYIGAPAAALEQGLNASSAVWDGALGVVTNKSITLVMLICVWLLPLLAWIFTSRHEPLSLPGWAFIDGKRPFPRFPEERRENIAFALKTAVWAGVIAILLLVAWRVLARATSSPAERQTTGWALAFADGQQALVIAVQVATALVVAGRARASGMVVSLFAAFVSGVLAWAGAMAVLTVAGCVTPISLGRGSHCPNTIGADFLWFTFKQYLNKGMLASGLAFGVIAALDGLVSWRQRRSRADAAGPAVAVRSPGRAAVAATLAMVVLAGAATAASANLLTEDTSTTADSQPAGESGKTIVQRKVPPSVWYVRNYCRGPGLQPTSKDRAALDSNLDDVERYSRRFPTATFIGPSLLVPLGIVLIEATNQLNKCDPRAAARTFCAAHYAYGRSADFRKNAPDEVKRLFESRKVQEGCANTKNKK